MRVVALLTVRNEARYMRRCLQHLRAQGVDVCVIDNDSTDDTREIAEQFMGDGVIRIERMHYGGVFDLTAQLESQQALASEIDADWFIRHDADEIMEAPPAWDSLHSAIDALDAQGFNAVNFDEFVFLPLEGEDFNGRDYVAEMRRYYFYEPWPLRLIRAWKKTDEPIALAGSGGHHADFDGRRLYPHNFILRHYIVLSAAHAIQKYAIERVYSEREVKEKDWHGWRARFHAGMLNLPPADAFKQLGGEWDRSDPKTAHLFVRT